MKQSKNYIGFVNDHSGSMAGKRAEAAIIDYNANITAIKDAANAELLDTVVSVVGLGIGNSPLGGYANGTERQVVISNPHVLKPVSDWPTPGNTPLYDGVGDMIELLESLPDAKDSHVSFLVMTTTDGEENGSRRYTAGSLRLKIEQLQRTGRWTFVFRIPKGYRSYVSNLGVPAGNIVEWETTAEGMAKATAATTQAMHSFYAGRSAGKSSSTVFYADATAVDTSKLVDISKRTSLYVVEAHENGKQIRDFILSRRTRYLKGAAFYQLTKTEARVGPNKMLAVRDRTTGVVYAGKEARTMLGLSSVDNIRLHPGNHGNYDLFIQSESVNRKLVAGTGVLYWEEIGVPFTQEEIDRFTGNAAAKPAAPAVVQLPAVPVTNKPTPSPLKPTPKAAPAPAVVTATGKPLAIRPVGNGRVRFHMPTANSLFYSTRDIAREVAHSMPGKKQYDAGPQAQHGRRFFVDAA
jgi:hypothetical protein